jgi:putative oxidoreductase
MKYLLSNQYLVFLTRIFLGLMFVVVSLEKIVEPAAFAQSIANYKVLSFSTSLVLATIVPWIELVCGLCILFGLFLRGSSLLLSTMVSVFTLAVLSALLRNLDIACGCFTQDPTVGKIGWMKIIQNLSLLALSLFLYFATSDRFSIEAYLRGKPLQQ